MRALYFAAGLLVLPAVVSGQSQAAAEAHASVTTPASIKWGPAPAVLPAGAKAAVLEGDPSQPGPFALRLWMPAGYTIPPHFHAVTEHVTVVQGTFLVGMGDQLDAAKFTELPVGTYGVIPPGMRHFARARGDVVIQLHGTGPWGLTYVNPADDPRGRATP
jgi:quercetin dioxygenase-like cupin family protein